MFDAHLRPFSLPDADLESLRIFGVARALVVACHPAGRLTASAFLKHFENALDKQVARLARFGIEAKVALGVSPQALPPRGLFDVVGRLPHFLSHPHAVALGGAGLSTGSALELDAFAQQAAWARTLNKPWLVMAPRPNDAVKMPTLLRTLQRLKVAPSQVMVDGVRLRNAASVLARGHWACFRLHPDAVSPESCVAWVQARGAQGVALSTAAGLGASNLLGIARAEALMVRFRIPPAVIKRATLENAAQWLKNSR